MQRVVERALRKQPEMHITSWLLDKGRIHVNIFRVPTLFARKEMEKVSKTTRGNAYVTLEA
eukprot:9979433-Lingulodinium_polyedra.AAC.1